MAIPFLLPSIATGCCEHLELLSQDEIQSMLLLFYESINGQKISSFRKEILASFFLFFGIGDEVYKERKFLRGLDLNLGSTMLLEVNALSTAPLPQLLHINYKVEAKYSNLKYQPSSSS